MVMFDLVRDDIFNLRNPSLILSQHSPGFPTDVRLDVLFEASHFADNPAERVDIVAVPGFGAAANEPWLDGTVNWLSDETMLPYWLPNARIMHVCYDSGWFGQEKTIQHWIPLLARELLRVIMTKRHACPTRPLIFIGHSLGGLIIKKAALICELHHDEFPQLAKSLAGIAFLGTPHRGSATEPGSGPADVATVAFASGCGTFDHLQTAMEREQGALTDLAWEFARLAVVHHIPLFCFFERPPDDETLVDEHSGTVAGFPSTALATGHFRLSKFPTPDDANYILVRDQLLAFTQGAANCVATRMNFPTDEVDKCLNALFITDPADDVEMIEHTKGRLFQGSGAWLHADPTFNEWLTCKRSRVLWLNGDPGKGKTMLAISAVKHITEKIKASSSGPSVLLAYFFCDNKDIRRNNSIAALRGLIYQLLHARPDLTSQFRALFGREGDKLFSSPTALRSLWRILKDFFASPSMHRVYIVIDALDELDEESIEDMLKLLSPLLDFEQLSLEDRLRPDQTDNCEVKWLLTSRNVRSISGTLSQTLNISLEENAKHVRDSVSQFIDVRVNQLREQKGYNRNLTTLVAKTLEEISEGTFLYVSMACGALSRPSVRLFDTDRVLRTFPKGLEPLYERMIKQIHSTGDYDHVQYATAILRAMVLALRPLTLQELAIMACLPEEHHSDHSMLQEYTSLCGSFITQRQGKVYFVHESVKEYLQGIDKVFSRPVSEYHANLAQLFLKMIVEDEHLPVPHGDEKPSILAYPSHFWMDHARQAHDSIDWTAHLSTKLFSRSQGPRMKWLDEYWKSHHPDWDTRHEEFGPLHLAAYGGIGSLVKALVARGDPINETDSAGFTPLIWAAKNGYSDVVELLLELGADYEARTPSGLSAVFSASINGHYRSLEKLIQAGAQVRVSDNQIRTPLHYAATNGHIKTVRVLLEAGSDVDAKDIGRHTSLQRASNHGELAIVSLLIQHNADIGVKDKEGRTLLHLAARTNDLNVLDFWLKNSNDLETTDDQSWTPLMHSGNDKVATRLINNGAQIEARTKEGHTALSLAILKGRVGVVKALLDGGANPNSGCAMNETVLLQAAWLGHVAICQLLLEAGANANGAGLTPLHQAAANGHEVTAKLLLQYGADPNAVNADGQTPGAQAAENNHHSLARYLRNREVSSQDEEIVALSPQHTEPLDPAVCELLKISPECGFIESHGKVGFSRPDKVTALVNGKATYYFMKSGPNGDMFSSEHAALTELRETVPTICPRSLGDGKYANNPGYFLLMEWMEVINREETVAEGGSGLSLPQKLGKLHNTPAKPPSGHPYPMFGWHRPTYCGSTRQTNTFHASWAKFYAENRLLAILHQIEETHGPDQELREGVKGVADVVVPRLLGNGHLGGRRGIMPVLVHGDLWHGNKAYGVNPAWGGPEDVIFDPSACYCHSEYEIGIMRTFGGFSAGFFDEYHRFVPKTEPKREYEDRIQLYQLYHYLNHYLIFRGAYKDNAMDIVQRLTSKYIAV